MIESLVESGVVSSNGEARRLMQNGGVSVDGEKVTDDRTIDGPTLIKKGKNTFVVVK